MKNALVFIGIISALFISGCVQDKEATISAISSEIGSYSAYSCDIFSSCSGCADFLEGTLKVNKTENKARMEFEQASGGSMISIFTGKDNLVSSPGDVAQKRYTRFILDANQPVSLSDYSTIEKIRNLLDSMQESEVSIDQQTVNNFGPRGIDAEMIVINPAENAGNYIKSFGKMMFYANTYLPAYIEKGEMGETFFYCDAAENMSNETFEMPSDFNLSETVNMNENCTVSADCSDSNEETSDTCEGYVNEGGYFSPGHCVYDYY